MKTVTLAICCVLSLSSCGTIRGVATGLTSPFSGGGLRGTRSDIDGLRFRTRVSATTGDGRGFVTSTGGAGRGVAAALEAGRVQAVAHCLRRFGGSEIVWTVGPDRPAEQVALTDGALVMSGACVTR